MITCKPIINNWLSKEECTALRSIAIICIILHNFAHKLSGAANENEFSYNIDNSTYFLNNLLSSDFIIHLFSFWGHLGVPIFVFLSAYGLSVKYGNGESINRTGQTLNRKHFLLCHYKKLFFPLLVGTIAYIIITYFKEGCVSFSIARFITQSTMILNLIYPYEQNITPGPYWYFGMTMQLYIFYLFFVYKKNKKWSIILTLVSIVYIALLHNDNKLLIWSKYNITGWLLPFILGIWSSRSYFYNYLQYKSTQYSILFVSVFFLFIFENYYYLWIFIPALAIFLTISLIKITPINMWNRINYIGSDSMYIFVIHPLIRYIMIPLVPALGRYGAMAIYIALTLIIAHFVSLCMKKCMV